MLTPGGVGQVAIPKWMKMLPERKRKRDIIMIAPSKNYAKILTTAILLRWIIFKEHHNTFYARMMTFPDDLPTSKAAQVTTHKKQRQQQHREQTTFGAFILFHICVINTYSIIKLVFLSKTNSACNFLPLKLAGCGTSNHFKLPREFLWKIVCIISEHLKFMRKRATWLFKLHVNAIISPFFKEQNTIGGELIYNHNEYGTKDTIDQWKNTEHFFRCCCCCCCAQIFILALRLPFYLFKNNIYLTTNINCFKSLHVNNGIC